jgi:PAS domain S-box-containing protein
MKIKLKILHLEDLPADAELVERVLKKSEIEFEKLLVSNKKDYEKALDNFVPDIILSDHSLPSFDSIGALNLLKEKKLNIPFILITATISEEFAVEVMKQGVADYILKDRMQRLPSAVLNAMEKWKLEESKNKAILELKAAHEKLVFHIENTPLGFIEWDKDGFVKSYSKQAEEIFGWTEQEFKDTNKPGISLVYEKDREGAMNIATELITGKIDRYTAMRRNYTKDGRVIWCEWFNSVLRGKDGDALTIMSLVQDVTERKEMEETLKQSEARSKEAQTIARLGNWELNFETGVAIWSEEACRIYGLPIDEIKQSYQAWASFIHPEDKDYVMKEIAESQKTLCDTELNHRIILKDGTIKFIHSLSKFKFDQNGKLIGLYGIARDVTESRLAEEERNKMIADIVQRNKALQQFAYIVSHNLRSPICNILGISNVLNDEISDTERIEIQDLLFNAVKQLDVIVKDLNNILQTRIEFNENKDLVFFPELVKDIQTNIWDQILDEKIQILTDFTAIDKMTTYKSHLHNIFFNLISNSIKFKQPGKVPIIRIKTSLLGDKVKITFKDSGSGIDLKQNGEKIFGLYKRFHPKVEGKGLGLFMVKSQVEVLGGNITVTSEPNVGTEFTIELPILAD